MDKEVYAEHSRSLTANPRLEGSSRAALNISQETKSEDYPKSPNLASPRKVKWDKSRSVAASLNLLGDSATSPKSPSITTPSPLSATAEPIPLVRSKSSYAYRTAKVLAFLEQSNMSAGYEAEAIRGELENIEPYIPQPTPSGPAQTSAAPSIDETGFLKEIETGGFPRIWGTFLTRMYFFMFLVEIGQENLFVHIN